MYRRVEVNDTRGHGCTIELRSMIHQSEGRSGRCSDYGVFGIHYVY